MPEYILCRIYLEGRAGAAKAARLAIKKAHETHGNQKTVFYKGGIPRENHDL